LGIAPQEEVDLVLPGHDRALDLGDLRRDQRQRGLGPCRLQAGGRSALQAAVLDGSIGAGEDFLA